MKTVIQKIAIFGIITLLLTQSCVYPRTISVSCHVADLIKAIQTANSTAAHDTLELTPDCVYLLTEVNTTVTSTFDGSTFEYGDVGLPPITTPITINGHNATITRDAVAPHFRIFYIKDAGDLTLNDLTVTNGFASWSSSSAFPESGGAIYSDHAPLTINRSTLQSNTADYYGGAIFAIGSAATYINDSTISDSAAPNGAGIFVYGGGLLSVDNSNIVNNNASVEGGGISAPFGAELVIKSSNISLNHSSRRGGGIFKDGGADRLPTTISGTTFQGNTADWGGGGIFIWRTPLSIGGSQFLENQAGEYGGGLGYENSSTETVLIRSTIFDGNTAVLDGGGIHFSGASINIAYSTFTNNNAQNGGAIHNGQASLPTYIIRPDTNMIVNHVVVINNSANRDGGGIFNGGALAIYASTFSNNTSASSGGGIQNLGEIVAYENSFLNNQSGSEGGGVSNNKDAIMTGSTFAYNYSNRGGGLASDMGNTVLTNDTFSNNRALDMGGGIFNTSTSASANMLVNHVTVAYNSASNGGGIATRGGLMKIKNSIVSKNSSGADCFSSGSDLSGIGENLNTDDSCPGFTLMADPLLQPLANNGGLTNTHALDAGSPAIDAAPDCTTLGGLVVTIDQRGQSRPGGSFCDLGAYEFVPLSISTSFITPIVPTVRIEIPANCREGTSPDFPVLSYLPQDMELEVQGINPSGTWYLVRPPDLDKPCWVWGQAVTPQGDMDTVEIVPDPSLSKPTEGGSQSGGSTTQPGCWVILPTNGYKTCVVPCPPNAWPGGACTP